MNDKDGPLFNLQRLQVITTYTNNSPLKHNRSFLSRSVRP